MSSQLYDVHAVTQSTVLVNVPPVPSWSVHPVLVQLTDVQAEIQSLSRV